MTTTTSNTSPGDRCISQTISTTPYAKQYRRLLLSAAWTNGTNISDRRPADEWTHVARRASYGDHLPRRSGGGPLLSFV
jgi:hypothetical protein